AVVGEEAQRLRAVGGLDRDGEVGLGVDDHPEAGAHELLVVDERDLHDVGHAGSWESGRTGGTEDAGGPVGVVGSGAAAGTGIVNRTRQPPPGRGPAVTEPPNIAARSRIPSSP